MKRLKKQVLGLLLCLAILGGYELFLHRRQDTTPPVITVPDAPLTISVKDKPSVLLSGVTAVDDRDGDVTRTMVVEGTGALKQDRTATVTLAAFDEAGNVAKAQRTVRYSDYDGMKFNITAPLVFPSTRLFDLLSCITVTDPVDGDLSGRIKASLTGGDTNLKAVGHHEVELRVTNSLGYTQRLLVPVEVYQGGTYNAKLELSQYIVYLHRGDRFDPEDYPQQLVPNSYTKVKLGRNSQLDVVSNVNPDVPGTYTVRYTAEQSGCSGLAYLVVVVEG